MSPRRRGHKQRSGSLVVWRGPSRYDGAPIMVTLVPTSQNVKTGNMVQVYVLREDMSPFTAMKRRLDYSVCGGCCLSPNVDGGCYVGTSDLKAHWQKVAAQPTATPDEVAVAVGLRPVRLGAYGDMAAVPPAVTDALVVLARGRVTNYTHGHKTLGFDAIEHMRSYTMLSVESLDEAAKAWLRGWRTYRIITPGMPTSPEEVVCPYTAIGLTCYDCLLCGTKGKKSIVVPAHGGDAVIRRITRVVAKGA